MENLVSAWEKSGPTSGTPWKCNPIEWKRMQRMQHNAGIGVKRVQLRRLAKTFLDQIDVQVVQDDDWDASKRDNQESSLGTR